jgi:hypothetical protein
MKSRTFVALAFLVAGLLSVSGYSQELDTVDIDILAEVPSVASLAATGATIPAFVTALKADLPGQMASVQLASGLNFSSNDLAVGDVLTIELVQSGSPDHQVQLASLKNVAFKLRFDVDVAALSASIMTNSVGIDSLGQTIAENNKTVSFDVTEDLGGAITGAEVFAAASGNTVLSPGASPLMISGDYEGTVTIRAVRTP